MQRLVIVDSPDDWPLDLPDVEVVSGRDYLSSDRFRKLRNARVFNICRSYRYQTLGYYVSLLAAARGHKPVPSVSTIQDMKSQTMVKLASEELDELIQKSLADIKSNDFVLSIYFGKNLARKYDRLSLHLYRLFHAPFVRAHFHWEGRKWALRKVGPISAKEIPASHHSEVIDFATEYFKGKRASFNKKHEMRFSMAILYHPDSELAPSNDKAIHKFVKAAEKLQIEAEVISRDDYSRLSEFDALFIRETTAVNHHTFRFARRAAAEGLVVIDDPESILKCTNKVFLAELLEKNHIPSPKTAIAYKENLEQAAEDVGFPCILKQPDSSFSQGVVKVHNCEELMQEGAKLFEKSDLLIAQEFLPTEFDWRVLVFDRKPLVVCKYFMAKKDWKIMSRDAEGKVLEGKGETLLVELAPKKLVSLALKTANLIGDGLYGLDIKQVGKEYYVIEINDNPNIDFGCEDHVLKDDLYMRIMEIFLKRMTHKKEGRVQNEPRSASSFI